MTTDAATSPGRPVPLWNIANILTMIRILLVPVFVLLFLRGTIGSLEGSTTMALGALAVFALAAATDKLDGTLARRYALVTDFGKLTDPIADKALVISALVLLSLVGVLPWWVTAVIIVRELGITLLRFVMVRRAVMAASSGGKLKAVLQFAFILALLVPWYELLPDAVADVVLVLTFLVVYAAVAITVLTGLDYVVKAVRIARAASADLGEPGEAP